MFIISERNSDVSLRKTNRANAGKNQVPRTGIEPTTHRFHDWRSTTELPRQLHWDGQSLNTDYQAFSKHLLSGRAQAMKSASRVFESRSGHLIFSGICILNFSLRHIFVVARNEPSIFHSWCYTGEKRNGKLDMNIELYLEAGKFMMRDQQQTVLKELYNKK